MRINFLKRVVENTAGEQAVKIVDLLANKKDINEFLIAKKLGLTINQTRNLLYKLSHLGIISSTRKKDKRRGWYIYFWTLNVLKSLEVLEQSISDEINSLKNELARKQAQRFYKCKICGREVNEETALLTDFVCSECGEVYELADTTPIINEISKNIAKLEKELVSIRGEIKQEKERIEQELHKHLKREERKKKALRKKLKGKEKVKVKSKAKRIKKSKKN